MLSSCWWKGRPDADSGTIMSMTLIPACLMKTNQKYSSMMVLLINEYYSHHHRRSDHKERRIWCVAPTATAVVFGSIIFFMNSTTSLISKNDIVWDIIAFLFFWTILSIYFRPTFECCLTLGEFRILITIATVCILEWIQPTTISLMSVGDTTISSLSSPSSLYAFVALSGVVGCALSLVVTSSSSSCSLFWQILINGCGPLLMVESCLRLCKCTVTDPIIFENLSSNLRHLLPLWFQWIFEFLVSTEDRTDHVTTSISSSLYPRYYGLVYWLSLGISLVLPTMRIVSPVKEQKPASNGTGGGAGTIKVVVRRKWFHLVAVLLFGPITVVFPQLLALGYAVALCGLAILEKLRPQVPALQVFYKSLIDPNKDDPNNILFSHMFLVLGCALPLWIQQSHCTGSNDNTATTIKVILSQWGVLSLGVGDAMGAIVGTYYGKHRWGRNRRTLEGSAAMWMSMMLTGGTMLVLLSDYDSLSSASSWSALLVATTFSTFIEAYTLQMDNIMLPLAGVAILSRL